MKSIMSVEVDLRYAGLSSRVSKNEEDNENDTADLSSEDVGLINKKAYCQCA